MHSRLYRSRSASISRADTIKEARLALGGVAHKPWRDREAEAQLSGAPPTRESFAAGRRDAAARVRAASATTTSRSNWRGGAILRALSQAARGTPQSQADKRIK